MVNADDVGRRTPRDNLLGRSGTELTTL